ncbi:uncharacterized protein PHACADRAFT_257308 [Phanerochaete carnosa HHB-10118-sp]|uniref:Transmembrane protein n=1 Tax=Phanerochaete carnosa (strain HHB-10118-sp) TaxID=650164 RepID=K5V148_PHACS|nr:uncharacterized protein PHACADRAFT_257308 [Phanerochaete carnosa HHB-10118-sp]EKM56211.1 hypothetical protein PHACADRAFT_257308 [Phanerochaete carnosa HHB-10118-sp]
MGGFVLDVDASLVPSPTPTPHSQSDRTRFVLTAQGVCFLMEHAPELIPDLSVASIRNRRQYDALAKVLLVVHLFYFCVSCALRLAQSLPLSLLELTTFAHAVCAVATYVVWWRKPFDIAEPTVIAGPHVDEMAAYMLMASRWTTVRCAGLVQSSSPSELSFFDISSTAHGISCDGNQSTALFEQDDKQRTHDVSLLIPGQVEHVGQYVSRVRSDSHAQHLSPSQLQPSSRHFLGPTTQGTEHYHRAGASVTRWTLAARVMARMESAVCAPEVTLLSQHGGLQESVFTIDGPLSWQAVPGFIAAVYGLIHLAAWNTTFPTPEEGLLWRVASCYALGLGVAPSFLLYVLSPAITAISNAVQSVIRLPDNFWHVTRLITRDEHRICIVLYLVFTFYLFMESIRQVFYLSGDAFMLPSFSAYAAP